MSSWTRLSLERRALLLKVPGSLPEWFEGFHNCVDEVELYILVGGGLNLLAPELFFLILAHLYIKYE